VLVARGGEAPAVYCDSQLAEAQPGRRLLSGPRELHMIRSSVAYRARDTDDGSWMLCLPQLALLYREQSRCVASGIRA
jgi:hypothetical protein